MHAVLYNYKVYRQSQYHKHFHAIIAGSNMISDYLQPLLHWCMFNDEETASIANDDAGRSTMY